MAKAKIEKSEYEKIVDMYIGGKSQSAIAQIYGVSQTLIGGILKKCNVHCKKRNYKSILEEDYPRLVQLYKDGYTQKEISNIFNTSESRVSQLLLMNGVHGIRNQPLNFTSEQVEEMYVKYCNKERVADIAKEYGIDYSSVYNLFHKYGFEVNQSHSRQIYSINENYFDKIDTNNKAYILGLLWADGCNSVDKHEIRLSLQENDKHILDSINLEIESNKPLRFIEYKKKSSNWKNQYTLDICNKHMSNQLASLGMVKAKSLVVEWPKCITEDMYRHFIRGYLDGDGCIYVGERNSEVSFVGTIMFIEELQKILKEELGINLCIKSQKGYKPVTKIGVISGNNQIYKFLEWIYQDSDLKLNRKYDKYQQFLTKYNNINKSCQD